jgi:hypothetical protein
MRAAVRSMAPWGGVQRDGVDQIEALGDRVVGGPIPPVGADGGFRGFGRTLARRTAFNRARVSVFAIDIATISRGAADVGMA